MKKVLLITFLFVSCSSVFAQVTESYKNTLKQMLESAGSEATFSVAIKQMFGIFRQQKSSVPDEVWAGLEAEFEKASMTELVEMLAPVYQKHLTEDDLKKIIEFYQTPAGKKYATKTPLITQESMQVGQQWGMKVGQQFMQKLAEKGY